MNEKQKTYLAECRMPSGVNSVLSSLNGFFESIGRPDLRVKKIRIQKRAFGASNRELTKDEYGVVTLCFDNQFIIYRLPKHMTPHGGRIDHCFPGGRHRRNFSL